ncbi:unnamed protein product, partial [Adineta steineri]
MEDVDDKLEKILVSVKHEIDKSFPSNEYDHQSGLSSLLSSRNIYASGYASQSSSTPLNQCTTANLGNGQNQTNYNSNSIASQRQATSSLLVYPPQQSTVAASSMDYLPQRYYPLRQLTAPASA